MRTELGRAAVRVGNAAGPQRRAGEAVGAVLRERMAARQRERTPFRKWSLRLPEPKTGRLNFRRYPFQEELYSQDVAELEEVVVVKAAQVGVSANLLRWVLYWADQRPLNALYVFPRAKQMYDFSDARVRPIIQKSEYLLRRIPAGHVQNKGLKQVGLGFVYFRGSESTDDLESVDADVLALDEYDNLVPANVPVAEHRISESAIGLMRRVGVPSYPNVGLNRLWKDTDRRRWLVKCRRGHELPMTWPASIDMERALRVCSKCREELRPEDIAAGRWVPEATEPGLVRGYHLPKMVVPELRRASSIAALVKRSRRTLPEELQSFWNRDVAEPWAPAEGRLDPEAIARAMDRAEEEGVVTDSGAYSGGGLVTMGVDVASVRDLNVRVSLHLEDERRTKRCLYLGTAATFDELDGLMERFSVDVCAIDGEPEHRLAMNFAERHAGRVYLVHFATLADTPIKAEPAVRLAKVRRTEAIDAMIDRIRNLRNLIPPGAPPQYAEHLQNLLRVKERRADGRTVVRYVETGPIDWAMAEVYDTVATDLWTISTTVEDAERDGELERLEDQYEFERSALSEDPEGMGYRSGFDEEGYDPGFGG